MRGKSSRELRTRSMKWSNPAKFSGTSKAKAENDSNLSNALVVSRKEVEIEQYN